MNYQDAIRQLAKEKTMEKTNPWQKLNRQKKAIAIVNVIRGHRIDSEILEEYGRREEFWNRLAELAGANRPVSQETRALVAKMLADGEEAERKAEA